MTYTERQTDLVTYGKRSTILKITKVKSYKINLSELRHKEKFYSKVKNYQVSFKM